MTRDEKNNIAYADVSRYLSPSMPTDIYYMECFNLWRTFRDYPEDGGDEYEE